ncbi:MAG TPA: type II secretion system F family protein [Bacteriovoracaceae bacterium]|nr:type II secretion system F family protein [Bacteriovoracaceae bacterium]
MVKSFFTIIFLVILSCSAWAQDACPKEFSQISASCIAATKKTYSDKSIILTKDLIGNIYLYTTPDGSVGKLRVVSTVIQTEVDKGDSKKPLSAWKKPLECTLFLEAVTFGGDKVYIPNSSISIGVEKNHWLKDRVFLDRDGRSAIELMKEEKTCKLTMTKGVELAFLRKTELKAREENLLLFTAPLILIFIAIFLIVRVFMDEQDKFKTQEALDEAENSTKGKDQNYFIKITKPFYKRYFVPLVQGSKNKSGLRTKYRQKLANAGLSKDMTSEEFAALKIFMILGGPFAFLAVRWIMSETWPLTITPVMAVVGYFYPNIWLAGLIKNRSTEILRAMPFIVDMLALSVEAGLDFMAAIQRVIEKAPPSPLVEEFETLIKETKIGSSRAEGLRQMSWRVNIIEINSFCATLIAADSVGASIGPILKQLSNELRVKRSSRAEQAGATAATKILIPMIFFILPAVLVAIFAPMFLKMMSGKL